MFPAVNSSTRVSFAQDEKVAYVSEPAQAVLPVASEASRASLKCLFRRADPDPKRKLRFKKNVKFTSNLDWTVIGHNQISGL